MEPSVVPSGYRFYPSDQELVGTFLRRFVVEQKPLTCPHDGDIHFFNMFGTESEPSEIWVAYGGPDLLDNSNGLYFLSEIKRVTPNGSNVVRKIGPNKGCWNGKAITVTINGPNGDPNPIGQKRTFGYSNKGSKDHGGWLLDEYSVYANPRINHNKTGYDFDFVLCRLRKKEGFVIRNNNNNKRKLESFSCSQVDDHISPIIKKRRTHKESVKLDDELESENIDDDQEEAATAVPQGGTSCPSTDNSTAHDLEASADNHNPLMGSEMIDDEEEVVHSDNADEEMEGLTMSALFCFSETFDINDMVSAYEEARAQIMSEGSLQTGNPLSFKEFVAGVRQDHLLPTASVFNVGFEEDCNDSTIFEHVNQSPLDSTS